MGGLGALRAADDAKKGLQVGKRADGLVARPGEDIGGGAGFDLDRFAPICGGAGGAEIPLKVGEGRFHENQIV